MYVVVHAVRTVVPWRDHGSAMLSPAEMKRVETREIDDCVNTPKANIGSGL